MTPRAITTATIALAVTFTAAYVVGVALAMAHAGDADRAIEEAA